MNPTAPGVYIVEVPSGSRTITGVATSIAAFVGRASKGPTDRAVRITNYGAFEREFGGLWRDSTLSYALRQFYQNGGSDAVIVRLVNTDGEAGTLTLANGNGGVSLQEALPGTGGHTLQVTVTDVSPDRIVTVDERVTAEHGADVTVRTLELSGTDVATLSAAFAGEDSLVELSEAFTALPEVAAVAEIEGEPGAAAARVTAPISTDTFGLEATTVGTAGDNLAVSIYRSATSDTTFTLVVEEQQSDGTYSLLGSIEATNLVDVAADVTALASTVKIATTGTPSALANPPLPVIRQHLGGGSATLASTLALGTAGLSLQAANEGEWGDQLRVTIDHDTSDSSDTTLFNLTIELVDENGQATSSELFRNVSISTSSTRFVTTVLEQNSVLTQVDAGGTMPSAAPAVTESALAMTGGQDGPDLTQAEFTGTGMQGNKEGLYRLEDVDLFNLLVIPPLSFSTDVPTTLWEDALEYCKDRRAMLLIDPPSGWNRPDQAVAGIATVGGLRDPNSVMYFPWIRSADPLQDNNLQSFVPSGFMAGIMARTDGSDGVWKAPAGLEAKLVGARELSYSLIDGEVGQLNPLGVNCLQVRPVVGPVSWGARTLMGADRLASEWKYLPVRRLALYIEESLYRGLQWAVFEPNDRALWQQLRVNVSSFMKNLYRRGAFFGESPADAFFVRCDETTTTDTDIDSGIVNVEVGFRPVKPAEFVIIRIRQIAGQTN